jgi:regulator of replication initiation timing
MAYKYRRPFLYRHISLSFREELDRQRAQANYQRLHAEGKTEEARADLARLAIIKQQRAEAAKRREEEKQSTVNLATLYDRCFMICGFGVIKNVFPFQ